MTSATDFRAKYSVGRLESLGAAALAQVAYVDVARLRSKLMDKLGWSAELCHQVEDRNRKYLALMLLYPGKEVVPTPFIDEFWHAHILDTVAYHQDCEQLFGSYQHHSPAFCRRPARGNGSIARRLRGNSSVVPPAFWN